MVRCSQKRVQEISRNHWTSTRYVLIVEIGIEIIVFQKFLLASWRPLVRNMFDVHSDAGWGSERNTRFCGRVEFSYISSGKMWPEKSARNIKKSLDIYSICFDC